MCNIDTLKYDKYLDYQTEGVAEYNLNKTWEAEKMFLEFLEKKESVRKDDKKTIKAYDEQYQKYQKCFLKYAKLQKDDKSCAPNGVSYKQLLNLCVAMIVIEKYSVLPIRNKFRKFDVTKKDFEKTRQKIIDFIIDNSNDKVNDLEEDKIIPHVRKFVRKISERLTGNFVWENEDSLVNYVFVTLSKVTKAGEFLPYRTISVRSTKHSSSPFEFCQLLLKSYAGRSNGETSNANNPLEAILGLDEATPFNVCQALSRKYNGVREY